MTACAFCEVSCELQRVWVWSRGVSFLRLRLLLLLLLTSRVCQSLTSRVCQPLTSRVCQPFTLLGAAALCCLQRQPRAATGGRRRG